MTGCLRVVAFLGVVVGLTACDTPVPATVHPDAGYTETAMSLKPPPADRARVYVFNGVFRDVRRPQVPVLHPYVAAILVNGVRIGTLQPTQVMVFDVPPGTYSFTWRMYDRGPALLEETVPSVHTVAGGTLVMMENDVLSGKYTMSSLREGVYVTPQKRVSPDFEVVRPQTCPPTICLP
jgi:hypothetical protein